MAPTWSTDRGVTHPAAFDWYVEGPKREHNADGRTNTRARGVTVVKSLVQLVVYFFSKQEHLGCVLVMMLISLHYLSFGTSATIKAWSIMAMIQIESSR